MTFWGLNLGSCGFSEGSSWTPLPQPGAAEVAVNEPHRSPQQAGCCALFLGTWIITIRSRLGNWRQVMASVPQVLILLSQSFPHIWHPISLSFIQLIVREPVLGPGHWLYRNDKSRINEAPVLVGLFLSSGGSQQINN